MYLIAELHNQYSGDIGIAEQMILQCKLAGAHAVKVQLFDAHSLYGTSEREYLSLSFDQVRHLQRYAESMGIELFASFFDEERLGWCLELDFPVLKIASIVVKRFPDLAQKAVGTGKRTLISLGHYDWKSQPPPFGATNVEYLYCISKYPAMLEDIEMPDFKTSVFSGYSDHTIGTTACFYAIARGANVIEKHFTLSPSLQKRTEQAHACGMTAEDLRYIRNLWEGIRILEGQSK